MNPVALAAVIALAGFVLSIVTALLTVGMAWGKMRADIAALQADRADLATKEQVNNLAVQVSEIRGMFRITLKPEHENNPVS